MTLLEHRARLARKYRLPLAMSGACFAAMFALRGWVQWAGPLPGDRFAIAHYSPAHPALPGWVMDIYVDAAKPWVVVLTLVVGMAVLARRVNPRAAAGLLLAELSVPINAVLKAAFGPEPLWSQYHKGAVDYPSGHVSYATAVFGYLTWISLRRRHPALAAVFLVILVGMGPERVLSGVHLPSDLVGGYLVGLGTLIPIIAWVHGDPASNERRVRALRERALSRRG